MAVVLVAGVVAALNLGNRNGTESLSVAGAAKATVDTGSARISMQVVVKGGQKTSVFPGGSVIDATGVADFVRGRYLLKGTSAGQSTETRVIGKDRWTKGSGLAGFGNLAGKPWMHSADSSGGGDSVLSNPDPSVHAGRLDVERHRAQPEAGRRPDAHDPAAADERLRERFAFRQADRRLS